MKQIRILGTFYDAGRPKYLAGALYPITDDTLREVAKGNGEEVDEPTEDEMSAVAAAQAEAEANGRAAAEAQAAADAAAAQQPAATSDATPAATPAPAPAPAAPTPARKRAGG